MDRVSICQRLVVAKIKMYLSFSLLPSSSSHTPPKLFCLFKKSKLVMWTVHTYYLNT
jgi:hypothetical protein